MMIRKALKAMALGSAFMVTLGNAQVQAADAICYNCPPQWADWATQLKMIEKHLGYKLPHDNKNSGQTLSQLLAEKANPVADVAKVLCSSTNNYAQCENPKLEQLFEAMNKESDTAKVRVMMREYERIVLDEEAYVGHALWWYKINPYQSYVKGWKIAPSHYLNQQLDNVWLDK